MKLPERLYYPLDKAALKLGCDISDIIHMAANGYINLCVKVYSPPSIPGSENSEWDSYLLVNPTYLNSVVSEYRIPLIHPEQYDEMLDGNHFARDSIDFDFVNSYVRLQGAIDVWIEKDKSDFSDFSDKLYGVYGLLQINARNIYIHEDALINGGSIEVSNFTLPEDSNDFKINGYFKQYESDMYDISIGLINKDSDYLRSEGVENSVSKNRNPVIVNKNNLYVTRDELNKLNDFSQDKKVIISSDEERDKTIAKKGDIIPALLKLIPELSKIDFEREPVSKIINALEKVAAKKGIELPYMHWQTWQKYLGKERVSRIK